MAMSFVLVPWLEWS